MKRWIPALLMFLAFAASAQDAGSEADAIRRADSAWSAALEAKDLEQVMSVYADDAVFLAPGQPILSGKAAIRDWFQARFAAPGYHASFVPTKITVSASADMAYETGVFHAQSTRAADGATLLSVGKHLVAWEKQGGRWFVKAESISTDAREPTVVVPENKTGAQTPTPASESACTIDARVTGTGSRHVLLLGGLSASPEEWAPVRDHLSGDYTTHLVSVPGLGRTPLNGSACGDIGDVASALAAYIRRTVRGKPVVVGHSAGGLATLQLASQSGDLLSGIVVIDALPFMAENFGATQVDAALQARAEGEYARMVSESPAEFSKRLAAQLASAVGDPQVATRIAATASNSDRQTYASLYRSTQLTDLRKTVPSAKLPTFVLFADQAANGAPAGFMRTRYAKQYHWLAPDHLLEIPASRHYVMFDQPDAFRNSLDLALESIFGGSQVQ